MHLSRELLKAYRKGEVEPQVMIDYLLSHCLDLCPICESEYLGFTAGQERDVAVPGMQQAVVQQRDLAQPEADTCASCEQPAAAQAPLGEMPPAAGVSEATTYAASIIAGGPEVAGMELPRELCGLEACDLEQVGRESVEAWTERIIEREEAQALPAISWLLLDQARQRVAEEPERALAFAEGVLELCNASPGEHHDLIALAYAHQGNANRALYQLERAQMAFDLLAECFLWPVTRPAVLGEIHSLWGSLAIEQRRFALARHQLQRATLSLGLVDDEVGICKAQINLANAFHHERRPGKVLETLEALMPKLRHQSPKLKVIAFNTLALANLDLGKVAAAAACLEEIEILFDMSWGAPLLRKLQWTRARILLRQGEGLESEALLQRLHQSFAEEGSSFHCALLDIDRARVAIQHRDWERAMALLDGVLPELSLRQLGDEYEQCLLELEEAMMDEQLSLQLLTVTVRTLESFSPRAYFLQAA